jgi:hypothetical protein
MTRAIAAFCGLLLMTLTGAAGAAQVHGDYLEARTADVYTGPCISNSEVFITGHQAVMAWKVNQGSWDGVDLGGLGIAAAVRGTSTFSEDQPDQARCVLIVDSRATPAQRDALVSMAKALGGERLAHVEAVKVSPISLTVEQHATAESGPQHEMHSMPQAPWALFWAPGLAKILTRPLNQTDHFCGNEVVAYAPLSVGVQALPAYTLGHYYKGRELDTTWDDPNCRSSFVGHFSY